MKIKNRCPVILKRKASFKACTLEANQRDIFITKTHKERANKPPILIIPIFA